MTETEKKKKKVGKDARTLITWGFGFILVVVVMAISNKQILMIGDLAATGITLLFAGLLVNFAQEFKQRHELKKYDTGTLAMIENIG